jgi:hypothetical protein
LAPSDVLEFKSSPQQSNHRKEKKEEEEEEEEEEGAKKKESREKKKKKKPKKVIRPKCMYRPKHTEIYRNGRNISKHPKILPEVE